MKFSSFPHEKICNVDFSPRLETLFKSKVYGPIRKIESPPSKGISYCLQRRKLNGIKNSLKNCCPQGCHVFHTNSPNRTGFLRVGTTIPFTCGKHWKLAPAHQRHDTLSLPMHCKTPFQNPNLRASRNVIQPQRNSSSNLNCSRYTDTSATAATPRSLTSCIYMQIYLSHSLSTYPNTFFHQKPQKFGIETIGICSLNKRVRISDSRRVC